MAQSTKKSTGRAASSGGKRTAPSGSNTKKTAAAKNTAAKSGGKSKSSSSRGKQASSVQERRPIRREVWAVICAALAVFSVLGCFGVEAIFIDFFCGLMKGFLG